MYYNSLIFRFHGIIDINKEIILIQERSLDKKNEYAQGKDYCTKLYEKVRNECGELKIMVRDSNKRYWFYFQVYEKYFEFIIYNFFLFLI